MKPRLIGIDIGSESDLAQCVEGLKLLKEAVACGEAEVVDTFKPLSSHRNTDEVLARLESCEEEGIDVLITGAGWANHLTGTVDAYLRYTLGNTTTTVIGVAFVDPDNVDHTQAAMLSISEVPKTQVVFEDGKGQFVGKEGFTRACELAIHGEFPEITIPEPKPARTFTLDEAIERGKTLRAAA